MMLKDTQHQLAINLLLGVNLTTRNKHQAKLNGWYNKGEVIYTKIAAYLYRNDLKIDFDYKFNDVIFNTLDCIIREYGSEVERKNFRAMMIDSIDKYIKPDSSADYYLKEVLYPMVSFNIIDVGSNIITIKEI